MVLWISREICARDVIMQINRLKVVYSQEPRVEVYCFRLNFNMSKLVYSVSKYSKWKIHGKILTIQSCTYISSCHLPSKSVFASVFFVVSSVFSATDLFCSSSVSVCCSGNAASRKEIYHVVRHTQEHGTEVFTPNLIAFEPIRKRSGNLSIS